MMAVTMARGKAAVAIVLSDGDRDELEAVARTSPPLPFDSLPEEKRSFHRRFCSIRFHGVISIGASTRVRLVETIRYLQIPIISGRRPQLCGFH
jgi:hypothetical protein